MKRHFARGFTLIELLVALVILALISVAGYSGLNAVLQTRERVAQETRKWQHLSYFFSRLELDIAQAVRRPVRTSTGSTSPEWVGHQVVVGDNDAELTFTRAGMSNQGNEIAPPQRIAFRFERGAIVMLHWPGLDQAPSIIPARNTLLEGIREFKLRYMDKSNIWQEIWPPAGAIAGTPSAVEIKLTLTSGENVTRLFVLQ
jgi:general secretion pathway protein J